MKTYDNGFDEKGKDKIRRKKGANSNLKKIQRYVASLNQEQISRMMEDAGKPYAPKGADVTANAIYRKALQERPLSIQAKLEISQPGDASEVQADKVADAVSRGDVNMSRMTMEQTGSEINMKGEGGTLTTTPEFNQQLEGTKGAGSKMEPGIQRELESHTGTDLSGVNIHTGSTADTMSDSINAKAFTHGQDIYFKGGNYDPGTPEGKSLLAHEVAHTVQQGEGVERKIQRQVGPASDPNFKKVDHPYSAAIIGPTDIMETYKEISNASLLKIDEGATVVIMYEPVEKVGGWYFVYYYPEKMFGYVKAENISTKEVVVTPRNERALNETLANNANDQAPLSVVVNGETLKLSFNMITTDSFEQGIFDPRAIPDKQSRRAIGLTIANGGKGFSSHQSLNIKLANTALYEIFNRYLINMTWYGGVEIKIPEEVFDNLQLTYSLSDQQSREENGVVTEELTINLKLRTWTSSFIFFDTEESEHTIKLTDVISPDNKWSPPAHLHKFGVIVNQDPESQVLSPSLLTVPEFSIPAGSVPILKYDALPYKQALALGNDRLAELLAFDSETGLYEKEKQATGLFTFSTTINSFIQRGNKYYEEKLVRDQSILQPLLDKTKQASLINTKEKTIADKANTFYNIVNQTIDAFKELDQFELAFKQARTIVDSATPSHEMFVARDALDATIEQVYLVHNELRIAVESSFDDPAGARAKFEGAMAKVVYIKTRESFLSLQRGGKMSKKIFQAYSIYNELKSDPGGVRLGGILETELLALSESYNSAAQQIVLKPSATQSIESGIQGSKLDTELIMGILHLVASEANLSSLTIESGVSDRIPDRVREKLPETGVASYTGLLSSYIMAISDAYYMINDPGQVKAEIAKILIQYNEAVVKSDEYSSMLSYMAFSIDVDNTMKAAPLMASLMVLGFLIAGPFGEGVGMLAASALGELTGVAVAAVAEAALFTTISHYGAMAINEFIGIDAPAGDFAQELKTNIMYMMIFRLSAPVGGGALRAFEGMPEMTLGEQTTHVGAAIASTQAVSMWMHTIETGELPSFGESMVMLGNNISMVLVATAVAPAVNGAIDKFIPKAREAMFGGMMKELDTLRYNLKTNYDTYRLTKEYNPELLAQLKEISAKEYELYQQILAKSSLAERRDIKKQYEALKETYEASARQLQLYFSMLGLSVGQIGATKGYFRYAGPKLIEFVPGMETELQTIFGDGWKAIDEKLGLYKGTMKLGRKEETYQFIRISEKQMNEKLAKEQKVAEQKRVFLNPSDTALLGTDGNVEFELVDDSGVIIGSLKRVPQAGNKFKYFFTDYRGKSNIVKNKSYDLQSTARLADSSSGYTVAPGENVLAMDFAIPRQINEAYSGLGEIMYEDALVYFEKKQGVDGIYGMWIKDAKLYKDYGGLSLNLLKFQNALNRGIPREQAAFETITGQWAQKKNYTKVEFVESTYDPTQNVEVIFKK